MYDTFTLNHAADFCVPLFSGVSWVPVNSLGTTSLDNNQVTKLSSLSPEAKREKITCLYEAVQYLQVNRFQNFDDNAAMYDGSDVWSIHKHGRTADINNGGCCASVANWLVFMLSHLYDEVGILSIISNRGAGHAVNCIRHEGSWFVFDATAILECHKEYVCAETGCVADFRRNKIVTGGLLKVDSLDAFTKFFSTFVGRLRRCSFLYYYYSGEIEWEGMRHLEGDNIEIMLPKRRATIIGEIPKNIGIYYSNYPFAAK